MNATLPEVEEDVSVDLDVDLDSPVICEGLLSDESPCPSEATWRAIMGCCGSLWVMCTRHKENYEINAEALGVKVYCSICGTAPVPSVRWSPL